MSPVVIDDEPLAARHFDGSKVIQVPILFVDTENGIIAETGWKQVSFAGYLLFPYMAVFQ
jgi:hypothetical protein